MLTIVYNYNTLFFFVYALCIVGTFLIVVSNSNLMSFDIQARKIRFYFLVWGSIRITSFKKVIIREIL